MVGGKLAYSTGSTNGYGSTFYAMFSDQYGFSALDAFTVNFVKSAATIVGKPVTIHQSDTWTPNMSFQTATDTSGNQITNYDQIADTTPFVITEFTTDGTPIKTYTSTAAFNAAKVVDGLYWISFTNSGKVSEPVRITVVADQSVANVYYQTKDGQALDSKTVQDLDVGSTYTTTGTQQITKDGLIYNLVSSSPAMDENNTVSIVIDKDGTQNNITFIYEIAKGSVTVHYEDENGHVLHPNGSVSGNMGETYAVTPVDLTNLGYVYVGVGSDSAPENGKLTNQNQTVTFVYRFTATTPTPEKAGTLTVKYVDEAGRTISPDISREGFVGNGYDVAPADLSNQGYSYVGLDSDSAPVKGSLTSQSQTIIFVYHLNSHETTPESSLLTIKFVDKNGKEIHRRLVQSGYQGNGYTFTPLKIAGYRYVGLASGSAPLSGSFDAENVVIARVYAKINQQPGKPTPPNKPIVEKPDVHIPDNKTPTINAKPIAVNQTANPDNAPQKLQQTKAATHNADQLPQTDEQKSLIAEILGMTGLISLLGWLGLKRKKE
ncbi:MucBP domain-containing protein [Pediococcus parvulus]|uniref:MucBP domain-containing protein n=1 Tax=Pediococcus parvulus TaxID=54062 RepID=UPI0021A5CE9D|nr:MucBP domain-containing protein [Pediococcus parvulus]